MKLIPWVLTLFDGGSKLRLFILILQENGKWTEFLQHVSCLLTTQGVLLHESALADLYTVSRGFFTKC